MLRLSIRGVFFASMLLALPAQGEVSPQQLEQVDQYLQREAARFHLPGLAFALVEGDEVVHRFLTGDELTEDSAFVIGSCSKTVTALAALLAFEEAGIDLDTPISEILPSVTTSGGVAAPTARQLLQHRSGLTRAQGFAVVPDLAELEARGWSLALSFPPGEQFSYCNQNYSWLGLMIEKATGQTFCEFVEERVFTPAGMRASSCAPTPIDNAAPEHQYLFAYPWKVQSPDVPLSHIPAGFMRCSVGDLARLQICLLHDGFLDGKQIFPRHLIQQMKTPAEEAEFGYGMGLAKGYLPDFGQVFAHEGATPTSYAFHGVLPQEQLGIVLLTNINLFDPFTDHGEKIYNNLFQILHGQEPTSFLPYRIWIRWALIPILLVAIWQAAMLVVRWRRAGWPFTWPVNPRQRLSWLFQLLLPIGIWWLVLYWVEVPLSQAVRLDPDIMWSFLFLTALGMVTGLIKSGGGEALQSSSKQRRVTQAPVES